MSHESLKTRWSNATQWLARHTSWPQKVLAHMLSPLQHSIPFWLLIMSCMHFRLHWTWRTTTPPHVRKRLFEGLQHTWLCSVPKHALLVPGRCVEPGLRSSGLSGLVSRLLQKDPVARPTCSSLLGDPFIQHHIEKTMLKVCTLTL